MSIRELPDLAPAQVVELQDALLANADRLLNSALAVLDLGNVALSRSLAILGMEESGKAIALHQRRVAMATEPEGEPFASTGLQELWADHELKLRLVHDFLVDPAGPPRHLDPQPPTRRRPRRVRLRPARHTHPHPTSSLRAPGGPDPTDPEVARTRNPKARKTPGHQGFYAYSDT
jgi:AbiV